jgi:NIPSNAP
VEGCGVVELRRYALRPGRRDTLIELFEREFVETQEAVGMRVLGTFCDADDPDSFVWMRGFADMTSRPTSLQAFYGGPVWKEHARAANSTMIDSDNVLLLRPVDEESSLALDASWRPPPGTGATRQAGMTATVCSLDLGGTDAFVHRFKREIEPALRQAGADVRARFVTERSENNFPPLPVREGEEVFVWLSLFADEAARDEHVAAVDLSTLAGDVEILRLQPTSRSLLPDR